jgi:uncharacterized protein YkwD
MAHEKSPYAIRRTTMKTLVRIVTCLTLAAAAACAGAADLYDAINAIRAGQSECKFAQKLEPLARNTALELAAQALSRGVGMPEALKDAAYRATTSFSIRISGDSIADKAGALIAKQYCAQVSKIELADIGVYQDERNAWIVLAMPFAPQVALGNDDAGQRVLELVNQARAQARNCGRKPFKAVKPVKWNSLLADISMRHAADMAKNSYFSHTGLDGSTPAARVTRNGYKYRATGENIAAGQTTPEEAVAGWIKSPPHCENLMNPVFTEMGVAYSINRASEMGVYWAQTFGTPR